MQKRAYGPLPTCNMFDMSTGLPGPRAFMPAMSVFTAEQMWWWNALCRPLTLGSSLACAHVGSKCKLVGRLRQTSCAEQVNNMKAAEAHLRLAVEKAGATAFLTSFHL